MLPDIVVQKELALDMFPGANMHVHVYVCIVKPDVNNYMLDDALPYLVH